MLTPQALPVPSKAALEHSQRLKNHLIKCIQQAKKPISFHRFMQIALYEPGLGYYVAGAHKIGSGGDFVTAPEISALYAQCLARQCLPVLKALDHSTILELGAGSGILAVDLLTELKKQHCLPDRYWILEPSPDLRQRQQKKFQQKVPDLLPRIQWLEQLPTDPIQGLIIANEVLDAMPVERFTLSAHDIQRWYVDVDMSISESDHRLVITTAPAPADIASLIKKQCAHLLINPSESLKQPTSPALASPLMRSDNPNQSDNLDYPGYHSEFNPQISGWCRALSAVLDKGLIILADYGYEQADYYHPERSKGTFLCHYQHHVHEDALCYPGLQDLTASVNFSDLAHGAEQAGFTVTAYLTQAQFLINNDLETLFNQQIQQHPEQLPALAQQVRRLTLPGEMGERFRMILLTKGFTPDSETLKLIALQTGDLRHRL